MRGWLGLDSGRDLRRFLSIVFAAMLVVVFGDWAATLVINVLSHRLPLWFQGIGAFSLLTVGIVLAYHAGIRLQRVRVVRSESEVRPCRVLVLPVSVPRNPRGLAVSASGSDVVELTIDNAVITLTGDLKRDIAEIGRHKHDWQWLQLLRGLEPHLTTVERIILLGSEGEAGSFCQLPKLRRLLSFYVDTGHVECVFHKIDFRNIEPALGKLDKIISEQLQDGSHKPRLRAHEVTIDITGGPKTLSVAGASSTLRYPEMSFQYVYVGERAEDSDEPPHYTVGSFGVEATTVERASP